MMTINVNFHFYSLDRSKKELVDFNSEQIGHSSTGLKTMFYFFQNICAILIDNGYDLVDKIWNFPENCLFRFNDDIIINCTYDHQPDDYKEHDIDKVVLGKHAHGWSVSRITINDLEFDNTFDASEFIRYYAINNFHLSSNSDASDFKWDWKSDFKVS